MIFPVNGIYRAIVIALVLGAVNILPATAQKDSTWFPHQISINMSKFIRGIFPSDEYAYEIGYRYRLNEKWALRTSISFQNETSETGYNEGRLKLGADRIFKDYGKWRFYYGADLFGYYISYKGTDRRIIQTGLSVLLGVIFYISPHFSLATEPDIYLLYNHYLDRNTFSENTTEEYWIFGFGNIGQIKVSFHF